MSLHSSADPLAMKQSVPSKPTKLKNFCPHASQSQVALFILWWLIPFTADAKVS